MSRTLLLVIVMTLAGSAYAGAAIRTIVLFSESFDDGYLTKRNKLNTLDLQNDRANRDGIVRGWFDRKLVIEHTNVIFRSTDFPAMKFNQFLMTPYFGPGLLPHAQKLWIDELTVGTKRIGPLPENKVSAGEKTLSK